MPTTKLTDRKLQSLTPPTGKRQEEFYDTEFTGGSFGVLIGPRTKSFFVLYRNQSGKKRRVSLGIYPIMSLAEARNEALATLGRVAKGEDVAEQRTTYDKAETVRQLAPIFIKRFVSQKKESTQREYIRILNTNILPVWGDRKLVDIKRADVIALVEKVGDTSPIMANRVRALLSKLFKFAIQRDLVENSPVVLTPVYKEQRTRQRTLTDEEIPVFWEKCAELEKPMGDLFKLALLTGQRTGEVKSMRWKDIHGDCWIVPKEVSKNGRANLVPLAPTAIDILRDLREKAEIHKSKTNHPGILKSISVFVFYSDTGGHIDWLQKASGRLNTLCKFEKKFTPHDLRRTTATGLGRLGVTSEIISKVLNHKTAENIVTARYNMYDSAKEKREALSKWAKHIDLALKGELPESNVIELRLRANA